jgi:hypothetical protein
MTERDSQGYRGADPSNVAFCVQRLNHTIGELARCYGVASVVAALTEVMGCSSCATDSVERGANILASVERMNASR